MEALEHSHFRKEEIGSRSQAGHTNPSGEAGDQIGGFHF
jgi:hypothetical protein